jgi:phage terminase large subunit-like protein
MRPHKVKDKEALKQWQDKLDSIISATSSDDDCGLDSKARIEKANKDFAFFVSYYFPHYASAKTPFFHVRLANKVKKNKTYKGWAKWGRGLAKSVNVDVLIPLWLWINNDIDFMVLIGQNADKAEMLLDDIKAEFEANQRLINDFGVQKNPGKWESGFFVTNNGFIAKSLGSGQDPRGLRVGKRRPDYLCFDDLETKETLKNPSRQNEIAHWIKTAVLPVMDTGNRRAIIAQNRFAEEMIFTKLVEGSKAWDIDRVDAYDPSNYKPTWDDKYDRWHFKNIEEEIGSLEARSEYNNTPHSRGKVFLDEYFQYAPLPKLKDFDAICGRWDVAYAGTSTADFNAVRVWGIKDGRKYLIASFVRQCKIPMALDWIADFQMNLPKGISIQFGFEAQFWNDTIMDNIEDCENKHGITLNLIKINRHTGKKYDWLIEMLPDYQNGKVFFSEELKSSNDHKVGLQQLKDLEPGYSTHEDAPDADKYCFEYLNQFKSIRKRSAHITQRTSQTY